MMFNNTSPRHARQLLTRRKVFLMALLVFITGIALLTFKQQSDTDVTLHRLVARRINSLKFGRLENKQDRDDRSFRCHTGSGYGNIKECHVIRNDADSNESEGIIQVLSLNMRGMHLDRNVSFGKSLSSLLKTHGPKRYLPNYFIHGKPTGRERDYRRGHVAFVHNTKTGGTTIKDCLQTISKQRHMPQVLMAHNDWKFGDQKYMALGQRKNRTIFAGPLTYRVCDVLKDRPCSYFTMVREPVSRMVSSFLFCKQINSGCSSSSVNDTLKVWTLKLGSLFFDLLLRPYASHLSLNRNDGHLFQQRSEGFQKFVKTMERKYNAVIPGRTPYRLDAIQRQELLNYCLENLEKWFSVIGITEDFNISLQLYEEVYGLPLTEVFTVPKNKGKIVSTMEASQVENMKTQLRNDPFIMEALFEDIKLYEKAKEIMTRQKQAFLEH